MTTTKKNRNKKRLVLLAAAISVILITFVIIVGVGNTPINYKESYYYFNQLQLDATKAEQTSEEEIMPNNPKATQRVDIMVNSLIEEIQKSTFVGNWDNLETLTYLEAENFTNQEKGETLVAGMYDSENNTLYVNELLFDMNSGWSKYILAHELMHSVFPVGFDFSDTKGYGTALNEGFTDLATTKIFGESVGLSYPELSQIARQLEFIYGEEIWNLLVAGSDEAIKEDFDSCLHEGDWVKFNQTLDAFEHFSHFSDSESYETACLLLSAAQEIVSDYFVAKTKTSNLPKQHQSRDDFMELLIWPEDEYYLEILGC